MTSNGSTQLRPLEQNVTYGQARGYEQANIEHYGTKTGTRGEPTSQSNRGNKINGFDVNSPSRPTGRQNYFLKYYNEMKNKLNGGCT